MNPLEQTRVRLFEIASDLLVASGLPKPSHPEWSLLFFPKKFALDRPNMTLEEFALTHEELKTQAETVSRIRDRITETARRAEAHSNEGLEEAQIVVSNLAKRLKRWNKLTRLHRNPVTTNDFKDPIAPGLRRRQKSRAKVTFEEKLAIAHRVLVEHEFQKDVAKEYRVSIALVSSIVRTI